MVNVESIVDTFSEVKLSQHTGESIRWRQINDESNSMWKGIGGNVLKYKVLKKNRQDLLLNLSQSVSKKDFLKYSNLIHRRSNNEPVAYILNKKEFWSKFFNVTKDTLIPRPETELLVDKILHEYKKKRIKWTIFRII